MDIKARYEKIDLSMVLFWTGSREGQGAAIRACVLRRSSSWNQSVVWEITLLNDSKN